MHELGRYGGLRVEVAAAAVVLAVGASLALAGDRDVLSGDPDGGQVFVVQGVPSGDGVVPAGGENCEQTGEYVTVFSGSSRYRGNVYTIESEGQLEQFGMELDLAPGDETVFYYYVYEEVDGNPNTYAKVVEQPIPVTGVGRDFYFSGPLLDDNGEPFFLPLVVGKKYFIAVAFPPGPDVSYGRNNRTHPVDFSLGKVEGLSGANDAPPLADELTINPLNTGSYSIKLCLRQRGACCVGGDCRQEFAEDCVAAGGDFTAPGVSCQDVDDFWPGGCPLPQGSCCFGDHCVDGMNQFACEESGGTYMGHYSTCEDSCERGACCFPDGTCQDGYTEEFCTAAGGSYRGDATSCDTVFPDCGNGACCVNEGCVDDIDATLCRDIGGTWQGEGTVCGDLDPLCEGVCCWDFGCDELSPGDCMELPGGKFLGYGASCNDFPDPCDDEEINYGSCCLGDGRCFITSDTACDALGGAFTLDGTCEDAPCEVQACCFDDGRACEDLSPFECRQQGGTPLGAGSMCALDTCPSGVEACCFPNGSCATISRRSCLLNGGIPLGPGTDCENAACTDPVACCMPDGSCELQAPWDCDTMGGSPRDKGVDCADAFCENPVPACCFDDGSCRDLSEAECLAQDGRPGPLGSSCSTFDCTINCDLVNKLKPKCKDKGGTFQFKAVLKTSFPEGTSVVVVLDGTDAQSKNVKANGKAKYKWKDVGAGDHTVCVEDCPRICKSKTCGA